jgi:release factor glutamine methyltransferase
VTRGQFINFALDRLHTSPSAHLDAMTLVMHVCDIDRAAVIAHPETILLPEQLKRLTDLLTRRTDGEPIAYLTGHREFWSLDFSVNPATLIPRPETELLVEKALARIPADAEWTIADLGTGCGAVALALACDRPRAHVIATDISQDALAVAANNAARHRLTNVEFRQGHWLAPLADLRLDMIVSNPPYVRDGHICLRHGDTRFENPTALTAGPDGLEAVREITPQAKHLLKPGGWLLLEHGADQTDELRLILQDCGYRDIVCHLDLSGLDRVSECRVVVGIDALPQSEST